MQGLDLVVQINCKLYAPKAFLMYSFGPPPVPSSTDPQDMTL